MIVGQRGSFIQRYIHTYQCIDYYVCPVLTEESSPLCGEISESLGKHGVERGVERLEDEGGEGEEQSHTLGGRSSLGLHHPLQHGTQTGLQLDGHTLSL